MKKLLTLLLTLVMAVSLTACNLSDIISMPEEETSTQGIEIVPLESSSQQSFSQDVSSQDASSEDNSSDSESSDAESEAALPEDGVYTAKEEVAEYIHLYGHLPDNFITKKEADALGWQGGSLESYAPGKSIGGDRFGNYEELLPKKKGRTYTECDIDTKGAKSRGAKRIVFSNDGLIYYTGDHYESFELLYGEE